MDSIVFYPLGDKAISVQLGTIISLEVNQKVQAFARFLEEQMLPLGITEIVTGFTTVTVYYDPYKRYLWDPSISPYDQIKNDLEELLSSFTYELNDESRRIIIPVCYGEDYGPDLEDVAAYHHLSPEEVIAIHSGSEYLVYMIGFAPGFPYLGGMPRKIATPRKSTPRLMIPAGSVGIGGEQTGVYPIDSPGGWQLIGRTPFRLFTPERSQPSLLLAGDQIRFVPISPDEYKNIIGEICG